MTTGLTVEKFAEIMGVEKSVAYGLLRFLADAGLVQTDKRKQPEGKKGKPATLYMLDDGVGERLAGYLTKFIGQSISQPIAVPIVAAPTDVQIGATFST